LVRGNRVVGALDNKVYRRADAPTERNGGLKWVNALKVECAIELLKAPGSKQGIAKQADMFRKRGQTGTVHIKGRFANLSIECMPLKYKIGTFGRIRPFSQEEP